VSFGIFTIPWSWIYYLQERAIPANSLIAGMARSCNCITFHSP